MNKDGDVYQYQLSIDRNVTVNCGEDVPEQIGSGQCRVVYRFPLLGTGENCNWDSQCESDYCDDEDRDPVTGLTRVGEFIRLQRRK